jgi:Domain of unknown function (DUF5658)
MKYLLAAMMGLMIADGLITQFLVNRGISTEGNPIMRPLVGDVRFIIMKVLGAILCSIILWDIYKRRAKLVLISTSCIAGCYGIIVIWNLHLFFVTP